MSDDESNQQTCIFKIKVGDRKGENCGRECLSDNKFCAKHSSSSQANAQENPCQFIKKNGEQCQKKATKSIYCGTHELTMKRREKIDAKPQCGEFLKNGKQCSRRAKDGAEFCGSHLLCSCGKKVHSQSLTSCLECDPESKCQYEDCNKVIHSESENNYCRLHYRIHEARDICMWPAGCRKKPYEKSASRFCRDHHQIRNMPQCSFLIYTRKTGTLSLCIDRKHGREDVYCKKHNKGCRITSESLSDDIDDHAIEIGRAVYLARRDGTAPDV